MSASVDKVIPGLTNPYPSTSAENAAGVSKKKGRRRGGGKRNKKEKNKTEVDRQTKCDNIGTIDNLTTSNGKQPAASTDILNPENLIRQLRSQLEQARELKDHQAANFIRQRIWLLQDAAAGVNSKISDEEMRAILVQTNNLNVASN